MKNKQRVLSILQTALGSYQTHKDNEYAFNCPFCHHHKKKLQVNIKSQKFHCWVCDASGVRIKSLLRKLRVDGKSIQQIIDIYGDDEYQHSSTVEDYPEKLELPIEYKPLYIKPKSVNPHYNQAISYLKKRNIGMDLIIKYNIGYCDSGLYRGRVIIPSYDENGELNYFEARTFYEDEKLKYKKPPVSRNVIVFDNHINWNEPITLVEGVFDAFSIRRNVIPMLGKFLLPMLKNKIKEKGVGEITLVMDPDAVMASIKHSEYFIKNGIRVKNVMLKDTDAGELGFEKTNSIIKETKQTNWDDLILTKIQNI